MSNWAIKTAFHHFSSNLIVIHIPLFKTVCLLKQHFEILFTLNFPTIQTGNKINTSIHNYLFDHR